MVENRPNRGDEDCVERREYKWVNPGVRRDLQTGQVRKDPETTDPTFVTPTELGVRMHEGDGSRSFSIRSRETLRTQCLRLCVFIYMYERET